MSGQTRRAGRYADALGRLVTWSVAEGRRGRRWRWTVADERGIAVVSHALETDREGRFSRLESATGDALLTLHREADGSVHGNRVSGHGVDHLSIPAPAPGQALVGNGALGIAALVGGIGPIAEPAPIEVIEVLDDLGVQVASCSIQRSEPSGWEVRTGAATRRVTLDGDGLPTGEGSAGASWPLEID